MTKILKSHADTSYPNLINIALVLKYRPIGIREVPLFRCTILRAKAWLLTYDLSPKISWGGSHVMMMWCSFNSNNFFVEK